MKKLVKIILGSLLCFLCVLSVEAEETDMIQNAKNGIVEIYSGYLNDKDEFKTVEHASGFLIYNQDNTAYVLTTYDTLTSDEYEEEAVIKVVVGKDVTEEADIFTYSKQENYAVLELRTSIAEKQALNFGVSSELTIGDTVYALGFPKNEDGKLDFLAYDVEIKEGEIQDTAAKKDNAYYIQHSAKVTSHNTGGPLLNEAGYVVGLNNAQLNEEGEEVHYSLPIDEIKEILDNYELKYGSNEKDALWNHFVNLYEECEKLAVDETYKKKTRYALSQEMIQVAPAFEESLNNLENSQIEEYIQILENGKAQLQSKTRMTMKVIYILAAVIVILGLWLVKLLLGRRKLKRNNPEAAAQGKSKKPKKSEKTTKQTSQSMAMKDMPYRETDKKEDMDFDGTVLIQEDEMKKYFVKMMREPATIVRIRDGKEVAITSEMFYLGRKPGPDTYAITGNSAISSRHAVISWEKGIYHIIDLGSANGTFVKGERLEKNVKTELANNERFVLADETFIFRIKI